MQVTGKQEREEREGGLLWSEHAWLRMVHAHAWGQDLMRRGREGCLEQACHGTVKSHAWGRGVVGEFWGSEQAWKQRIGGQGCDDVMPESERAVGVKPCVLDTVREQGGQGASPCMVTGECYSEEGGVCGIRACMAVNRAGPREWCAKGGRAALDQPK